MGFLVISIEEYSGQQQQKCAKHERKNEKKTYNGNGNENKYENVVFLYAVVVYHVAHTDIILLLYIVSIHSIHPTSSN